MRVLLFLFMLSLNFQSVAKGGTSILAELSDICLHRDLKECESKFIGNEKMLEMVLFVLQSKNITKDLKALHFNTFGEEEFNKYFGTFDFTMEIIDFSKFKLLEDNDNKKVFLGEQNMNLVTVLKRGEWVVDLDQSNFTSSLMTNGHEYMFMKKVIGTQKLLIKSIKSNSSAKDIYINTGLYMMATFYDSTTTDKKREFDDFFKSRGTSFDELNDAILKGM